MTFWKNSRRTIFATQMATVVGAGLLAIPLATMGAQPALAHPRASVGISMSYFSDRLSRYGYWVTTERWGRAWHPRRTGFRPYFDGEWQYTREYGWYWVSDEPWADITYHYGRWVYDPDDGWLWVPGYVWGPAWVIWRDTGSYIGWFPMPPDYYDFYGSGPRYSASYWYGYRDWYGPNFAFTNLWVFMPLNDFGRDISGYYVKDQKRLRSIYNQSSDRTRYDERDDHVVNVGRAPDRLPASVRQRLPQRSLSDVRRDSTPMASITQGRALLREERQSPDQRNGRPGPGTPDLPQRQQPFGSQGQQPTPPADRQFEGGNRPSTPGTQTQPGQPPSGTRQPPQRQEQLTTPQGQTQTPPAGNRPSAPDTQTRTGQAPSTTGQPTQPQQQAAPQAQPPTAPTEQPPARDNRLNRPTAPSATQTTPPVGDNRLNRPTAPSAPQTPPPVGDNRPNRPSAPQVQSQPAQQQAPQPPQQPSTQPPGTGQPNVQAGEKPKEGAPAPGTPRGEKLKKPGEEEDPNSPDTTR